jgi:predicted nucleic acid-binding protein
MDEVVIDASALVDLLLADVLGDAVAARISGTVLHGPAHLDAEVLSALGRMNRSGDIQDHAVRAMIDRLLDAPVVRHPLAGLLPGAWKKGAKLRLADAIYVELAESLNIRLVTTDKRLRSSQVADVVSV